MAYEKKEGDFSLFPNNRKTKDNQPDWRGSILINGEERELAAWTKSGSKGSFLSGKLGAPIKDTPTGGFTPAPPKAPPPVKQIIPFDDDVPWT